MGNQPNGVTKLYYFKQLKSTALELTSCETCKYLTHFDGFGLRCNNQNRIDVSAFTKNQRLAHFKKGTITGASTRPFKPLALDYKRGCDYHAAAQNA